MKIFETVEDLKSEEFDDILLELIRAKRLVSISDDEETARYVLCHVYE